MFRNIRLILLTLALALGVSGLHGGTAAAQSPLLIAAWGAAQQVRAPGILFDDSPFGFTPVGFSDQTVRQVARLSVGGSALRIRLSNAFGDTPITFGAATVGLHGGRGQVVTGTTRQLSFSGQPTVTIPAGAAVTSDAVAFTVAANQDVAVSLYLPAGQRDRLPNRHDKVVARSYVAPGNNSTSESNRPFENDRFGNHMFLPYHGYWLDEIDVVPVTATSAVVTLGDDHTDVGVGTYRWPGALARRLNTLPPGFGKSVANSGIYGNLLTAVSLPDVGPGGCSNQLSAPQCSAGPAINRRLERDVFSRAGVRNVFLHAGQNDLKANIPPTTVIEAYQEIINQGHAKGLRVIGATLVPHGSNTTTFGVPGALISFAEYEAGRQAVNTWIRTSGAFDDVVDFDVVVRDPVVPARLDPRFEAGDAIHVNEAGHTAIGNAIDLGVFR